MATPVGCSRATFGVSAGEGSSVGAQAQFERRARVAPSYQERQTQSDIASYRSSVGSTRGAACTFCDLDAFRAGAVLLLENNLLRQARPLLDERYKPDGFN